MYPKDADRISNSVVPDQTALLGAVWSGSTLFAQTDLSKNLEVAERLALPISVHGVAGSNPAGGEILPEPKRRFIAQSLSCSSFHRLKMTEILLNGRKTLTHPSMSKNLVPLRYFRVSSRLCAFWIDLKFA